MAETTFASMPRTTGALRNAPKGTAGPTNATVALNPLFVDHGYIGEDGFTESTTRDTDKKRALGGSVVRVLQTEFGTTVQFVFLESMNLNVLKRVYGEENVTTDGDGNVVVKRNKKPLPREAWVIDLQDGTALDRSYIPDGQIIEIGDITKVHSDLVSYEVTIECYEDEDGTTLTSFLYSDMFEDEAPSAPVVKTVTVVDSGETFTLSFGGQTTSALNGSTTTSAALQTALTGLSSIGAGKATVTGSNGGPYTVTLDATLVGTLTGSNATVA